MKELFGEVDGRYKNGHVGNEPSNGCINLRGRMDRRKNTSMELEQIKCVCLILCDAKNLVMRGNSYLL